MQLDRDLLQKKLMELHEEHGHGFWAELERSSGTSNLHRTAKGKHKVTYETWMKLHTAMPEEIPPPTNINGSFVIQGNNNVQSNNYIGEGNRYAPELIELMDILTDYAAPVEIRKLLAKYRKIKKEREG